MSQLQVSGEAKIRDIQGPVVANSGVITALDGAASQYVRGDGTLADFPTSTGGGSSVSYYLNSSVSQGTIGGVAYRELSKEPIIGAGTDITISANGYVASYITDANDPDVLSVPGGNFNCEFYFSVNNNTGNPTTYAELYKYDGTTFTLLGSSQAVPESINQGTTIAPYYFAIPVATAALALTDRLAIRIYVSVDGRVVTLHTENSHLCQVVTTFSKGMVSLNNLTDQSQFITTGTSGTNFNIVSSGDTHTFNLPVASATNTGKLSSTDWSTFNNKVPYTGATASVDLGVYALSSSVLYADGLGSIAGFLYLKQNTTTSQYLADYSAIGAYSNGYVFNIATPSVSKQALLDLSLITASASRTFTLPDLSGTLALLEGTQTFSGSKTFSAALKNDAGVLLKNGFTTYSNGYTSLSGDVGNLVISGSISSTPFDNELAFTPSTSNTYTFPNASGTIALTSNIPANIVTGTGTTNTLPKFTGTSTVGNSNITDTGSLITLGSNVTTTGSQFVQNGFYLTNANAGATAGYTHMWGADDGIFFGLRNATGGAKFVFQSATSYNYTFPAATGTLALTSNLSAYLPLTGGTLTGPLSGTTADFSGLGTFYQLTMTGATAGRIFYAQTGGVVSQSGNLNWNETNGMLGVGTPNPSAVITAFSTNAATQFKAAGTAPAFTFSNTLTSASLACVFGLATSANHFVTGTAAGDMAIANQSTVAGAIVFGTGTAEKMRMSPSGRFLIGTSVDSGALFQVAGAATFSSSVTANGTVILGSNSSSTPYALGTSTARFQLMNGGVYGLAGDVLTNGNTYLQSQRTDGNTAAYNLLLQPLGGNVGIGTSSPSSILDVKGTGTYDFIKISNGSTSGGGGFLSYQNGIASSWFGNSGGWEGGTSNDTGIGSYAGGIRFYTNGGTEKMRITSGGNVAIGLTNDTYRLTVANNGGSGFIGATNQAGGTGDRFIRMGFGTGATFAQIQGTRLNVADDVNIVMQPGGGNVLIGTTTAPSAIGVNDLLVIGKPGSASNAINFSNGSTTNWGYLLAESGKMVFGSGSSSNITFETNGGSERMRITSGGNVNFVHGGGYITSIQANNQINTTLSGNGAPMYLNFQGNAAIYAGSSYAVLYAGSDRRIKTDIVDAESTLNKILSLTPRIFKYKERPEFTNYGFIAQEVEEVMPEIVKTSEGITMCNGQEIENQKSIESYGLAWASILVKAIQEQQTQIEELKALINK